MLVCIYAVLRRGMGAWYFQQKSPQAIQKAIRWDPCNAEYYDALATLRHLYADNENPGEQVQLYLHATSFSPQNAHFWTDLGMAYDWAGNRNEAMRAFAQAIELSPNSPDINWKFGEFGESSIAWAKELSPNSPDINWKFANFCVRTGKTSEGLQALGKVLIGGTVPR